MNIEQAMGILTRAQRVYSRRIAPVVGACELGRVAMWKLIPRSPYPDGDESVLACPFCSSGEYLHNEDGNRCVFCGNCGQAIAWPDKEGASG